MVERDLDVQRMLAVVLRDGHELTFVASPGKAAIGLGTFDLVIVDPGSEIDVSRIRIAYPKAVVLVTTANTTLWPAARGSAVLAKPYHMEDLMMMVHFIETGEGFCDHGLGH